MSALPQFMDLLLVKTFTRLQSMILLHAGLFSRRI